MALLFGAGLILIGCAVAMARAPKDANTVLVSLACACVAFLAVVSTTGRHVGEIGRRELVIAGIIGLTARVTLLFCAPVLEDDVNRYLWDGAVLAEGHSPYAFSPQQIYDARMDREQPALSEDERAELATLADLSRTAALEPRFLAINYPSVPTIYPPATELVFAGVAKAAPGSLVAMKVLLVALDTATAFALLAILISIGAPRGYALLYWWNPLIILSFSGSAHMDALPMALLTLAIAFALRSRALLSGVFLGVAAATKLFPIVCWPALRRSLGMRGTVAAVVCAAGGYLLLLHPRMFEGLITFAKVWQINGAIHAAFALVVGSSIARILAGLVVITVAALTLRKEPLVAISWTLGALVLASPAVNPWYVAWLVPVAAARRSLPLLALSMTVLASYVRFRTGAVPTWLPPIEFGIPLAISAICWRYRAQPPENSSDELAS